MLTHEMFKLIPVSRLGPVTQEEEGRCKQSEILKPQDKHLD